MLRSASVALCLLWAAPAAADVTARYTDGNGVIVILEADDSGAARFGAEGAPTYQIFTADDGFIIESQDRQSRVIRWADLAAYYDAEMARLTGRPPQETRRKPSPPRLASAGTVTIEGRDGTEYLARGEPAPAGQRIVISTDPALTPVGRVFARLFQLAPTFGRVLTGRADDLTIELGALVAGGAPLQLGAMRLVDVSFAPVPAERFVLPAPPLSREATAAALRAGRTEAPAN